jgi:hypothetical protein
MVTGPDSYKYKIVPKVAGREEQWLAVGLRVASLERAQGMSLFIYIEKCT